MLPCGTSEKVIVQGATVAVPTTVVGDAACVVAVETPDVEVLTAVPVVAVVPGAVVLVALATIVLTLVLVRVAEATG